MLSEPELEVCERKMVATQSFLDGNVTTSLGWSEHRLERKLNTSKEHQPQSQLNNYMINLIKRDENDSNVDKMYHAEQENELLFRCRLG